MFHLRTILMVLVVMRMLMPPGICVCKWNSPASRFLVTLLRTGQQVPPTEGERDDDDHAPGCPASPLAAGMGVKPPSEPLFPPDLSLDPPPPLESERLTLSFCTDMASPIRFDSSQNPLYLTLRALLI